MGAPVHEPKAHRRVRKRAPHRGGRARDNARPSMKRRYDYPPELATYVREHWPAGHALRLSPELLSEALSVAFEASLTLEESRPTRFRLLLTDPNELPET